MTTSNIATTTQYDIFAVNCSTIRENLFSTAHRNFCLIAVYAIYLVIGCFGNGLLVVLFMKDKTLRNFNNALITNMAISDFLYVGVLAPMSIFDELYQFRPFGKNMCIFYAMVCYASQDVSILSLTGLSYFRYRAVVRPFQSRMKSRSKLIFTYCVMSWLIGAAVSVFPATYCEEYPRSDCFGIKIHEVQYFVGYKKFYKYFWVRFIFLYLLPLLIISYFYGRLAYTLCITSTSLQATESAQANNEATLRSRKKLSVIVLIIVVTFFISWLPNYVFWLSALDDKMFVRGLETGRMVTVFFVPSTMNPIILFVTSTGYRNGLLKMCSCRRLMSTSTLWTSTFSSQLRKLIPRLGNRKEAQPENQGEAWRVNSP